MKHSFFILITIFSLMVTSCGSLYQSTPKKEVYHTAQYEGGKKQDGVINMYITYNPFTENPKINMPDSKPMQKKYAGIGGILELNFKQKSFMQIACLLT